MFVQDKRRRAGRDVVTGKVICDGNVGNPGGNPGSPAVVIEGTHREAAGAGSGSDPSGIVGNLEFDIYNIKRDESQVLSLS
jgi:hypothetical protein